MDPISPTPIQTPTSWKKYVRWFSGAILVIVLSIWVSSPPHAMPIHSVVRVEKGDALSIIAQKLYDGKYIRSTAFFQTLVMLSPGKATIVYGDYYFDKSVPVWTITSRMVRGMYNISQVRATIWEGMTVREISELLQSLIPSFDPYGFQAKAKNLEGYLFPDTYFFSPFAIADDVIKKMNDNFNHKIKPLEEEILDSGNTKNEIITMASIIEKESNGTDQKIISGILWNRIRAGVPLQVDASFIYLLGKESKELTLLDLKTDSPYNTYMHKGLPPGPIGNPGLEAIVAAIHPEQTSYMFYLHSSDGTLHPAKTFAEHVKNKQKYLK